MPLYEYRCTSCDSRFEALVQGSQRPACAACGGRKLEKLISAFAVATSSGGSSASFAGESAGGCGQGACGRGACDREG